MHVEEYEAQNWCANVFYYLIETYVVILTTRHDHLLTECVNPSI